MYHAFPLENSTSIPSNFPKSIPLFPACSRVIPFFPAIPLFPAIFPSQSLYSQQFSQVNPTFFSIFPCNRTFPSNPTIFRSIPLFPTIFPSQSHYSQHFPYFSHVPEIAVTAQVALPCALSRPIARGPSRCWSPRSSGS